VLWPQVEVRLITTASLKTQTWKDLAEMARTKGLSGYHSMKKDQLVKLLVRNAKAKSKSRAAAKPAKAAGRSASAAARGTSVRATTVRATTRLHNGHNGAAKPNGKPAGRSAKQARIAERIQKVHAQRERLKDLSGNKASAKAGAGKDRIVLMVRDPFWLHACWTVTNASVKRAEAALAAYWHTARPVLRLLEVDGGNTTSTSERVVREMEVHGGVTNWYIDVSNPPQSYRVDLGYRASNGKFFAICRSNAVTTPAPDAADSIDENWSDVAENYERVYALSGGYHEENSSGELQELFEERLRRPMNSPLGSQFGVGAERVLNRHRDFQFNVDAEMILFGNTKPDARVTLAGDPVKIRPDGSFTVRISMPDKRQVLPVVASSADGVEQRTIVIAVERNTKVLEPMVRENNE
jgi:uncharacterized protein